MGAIIAVPVTVAVLAPSFKTVKEYSIDSARRRSTRLPSPGRSRGTR